MKSEINSVFVHALGLNLLFYEVIKSTGPDPPASSIQQFAAIVRPNLEVLKSGLFIQSDYPPSTNVEHRLVSFALAFVFQSTMARG